MNKEDLLKRIQTYCSKKEIINAFKEIQREEFVLKENKNEAYKDTALPIGYNQTISQPYTLSLMLELLDLKEGQKVLEIGSGSGYLLALISTIIKEKGKVYGIERVPELAKRSKEKLAKNKNIEIHCKNGALGHIENAPYDRIIISAAIKKVPQTILQQLKNKGKLVAPKGEQEQSLICIKREGENFKKIKEMPGFIFVPFIE